MNKPLGMITEKEFLKAVGICKSTLQVYLCRAEFSHIQKVKMGKNKFVYKGVGRDDIRRLREFKNKKKGILHYS